MTMQLAKRFDARYVLEPQIGLSRARNTGARAARGDIVAFTDDDGVPDSAWLRCHADALSDTTLAATTGRVVSLDTSSTPPGGYEAAGVEDLGTKAFRVELVRDDWFERTNFGGVGVGGNIALRRELFRNGWGFREDLGLGRRILGEEHYAFFELVRAGHAIAYVPDAVIRHEAPRDLEAVELRMRRTLRGSSAYMVMLLVEERGYRLRTLRYALGALRGRRRAWRNIGQTTPFANARERRLAGLAGPTLYVSNCVCGARRGRHRPPPSR